MVLILTHTFSFCQSSSNKHDIRQYYKIDFDIIFVYISINDSQPFIHNLNLSSLDMDVE